MTFEQLSQAEFATLPQLVAIHAMASPDKVAISEADRAVTWCELDEWADRIAARLQRDGVTPGAAVAIAGANSAEFIALLLGTLRIGGVAAMITASATGPQMSAMIADSGAHHLFLDEAAGAILYGQSLPDHCISLDGGPLGTDLFDWMDGPGAKPRAASVSPDSGFNIIYSSGTTGVPKGIIQSNMMRWLQIKLSLPYYGRETVTIVSTPLYSNTTMGAVLPTIGGGGRLVLMRKFEARAFLELAERERVTTAMLVPVQYRRIMADPEFDHFDLSSFVAKMCTSAPFPANLKADVVKRWPGLLIEFYGMTEGGATFALDCTAFPDKLHTVGRPAPGNEAKIVDEQGNELPPGQPGEIVGRSATMMSGYNNRPDDSARMFWTDKDGTRFLRQGDIGYFDEDGFLVLLDRAKDMIISGGFNIYSSDLEAALLRQPGVIDAAVVGAPSREWGETPVGFVVMQPGTEIEKVRHGANALVGKTQRLSRLMSIGELPRSPIGKVIKRQLREWL